MIEEFELDEKVAIVTGGGTGIGKAIALALAEAGANIVVAARRIEPLESTAAEVEKLGRRSMAVQADITNSEQVDNAVAKTVAEFGRVDILVNNAGQEISLFGIPITDISDDQWRRGLEVDLTGTFYYCRAVAKYMLKQKQGKIINISSGSGLVGLPATVVYGVAKAGVIQLTRILGIAWARKGINVNCVVIASRFRTEATEVLSVDPNLIPIGRFGEPGEIGPLTVFLASKASDYMTAGMCIIDGGVMADRFCPGSYFPTV